MTHDNKKALKAGFWYTFSNFLIKGIAFLTMPIFTRIMSKYDIGVFMLEEEYLEISKECLIFAAC